MEITMDAITALLLIIGIDLVLAGDNAIVIGLAARGLPPQQQRKAILIGTIGAVAIRASAAAVIVMLIQIPWLHLIGGLLLVVISYHFIIDHERNSHVKTGKTLWSAVRTIIIADALMGLDNVLAIAGAAGTNITLIIIGLLISVPLVMLGSTLIIRLMDRYPWLVYVGSALLAFTAGKMIVAEPIIETIMPLNMVKWLIELGIVLSVLGAGWFKLSILKRKRSRTFSES